jgi:hypothetical protein
MPNDDVQLARNEKLETLTCAERIDCLVALLSQKNILAISPQEYAGAVDKYYNEVQGAKNARKEQREKDLVTTTTKLQANIKKVVVGIMLVTILAALLSLAMLAVFKPTLDPSTMPLHSGTLLSFLGFIVRLQPILRRLRVLKDKITALKEKANFDAEQSLHAENLMRIIRAEALLVWVGVRQWLPDSRGSVDGCQSSGFRLLPAGLYGLYDPLSWLPSCETMDLSIYDLATLVQQRGGTTVTHRRFAK